MQQATPTAQPPNNRSQQHATTHRARRSQQLDAARLDDELSSQLQQRISNLLHDCAFLPDSLIASPPFRQLVQLVSFAIARALPLLLRGATYGQSLQHIVYAKVRSHHHQQLKVSSRWRIATMLVVVALARRTLLLTDRASSTTLSNHLNSLLLLFDLLAFLRFLQRPDGQMRAVESLLNLTPMSQSSTPPLGDAVPLRQLLWNSYDELTETALVVLPTSWLELARGVFRRQQQSGASGDVTRRFDSDESVCVVCHAKPIHPHRLAACAHRMCYVCVCVQAGVESASAVSKVYCASCGQYRELQRQETTSSSVRFAILPLVNEE